MKPQPDRDAYADAERRAAAASEVAEGRSNADASRILALDVLADWLFGIYVGSREQIAWALLWAENAPDLVTHERALRDSAWQKIHDDADQAEWERLGLRGTQP